MTGENPIVSPNEPRDREAPDGVVSFGKVAIPVALIAAIAAGLVAWGGIRQQVSQHDEDIRSMKVDVRSLDTRATKLEDHYDSILDGVKEIHQRLDGMGAPRVQPAKGHEP